MCRLEINYFDGFWWTYSSFVISCIFTTNDILAQINTIARLIQLNNNTYMCDGNKMILLSLKTTLPCDAIPSPFEVNQYERRLMNIFSIAQVLLASCLQAIFYTKLRIYPIPTDKCNFEIEFLIKTKYICDCLMDAFTIFWHVLMATCDIKWLRSRYVLDENIWKVLKNKCMFYVLLGHLSKLILLECVKLFILFKKSILQVCYVIAQPIRPIETLLFFH